MSVPDIVIANAQIQDLESINAQLQEELARLRKENEELKTWKEVLMRGRDEALSAAKEQGARGMLLFVQGMADNDEHPPEVSEIIDNEEYATAMVNLWRKRQEGEK